MFEEYDPAHTKMRLQETIVIYEGSAMYIHRILHTYAEGYYVCNEQGKLTPLDLDAIEYESLGSMPYLDKNNNLWWCHHNTARQHKVGLASTNVTLIRCIGGITYPFEKIAWDGEFSPHAPDIMAAIDSGYHLTSPDTMIRGRFFAASGTTLFAHSIAVGSWDKANPFNPKLDDDYSYMQEHLEEAWIT